MIGMGWGWYIMTGLGRSWYIMIGLGWGWYIRIGWVRADAFRLDWVGAGLGWGWNIRIGWVGADTLGLDRVGADKFWLNLVWADTLWLDWIGADTLGLVGLELKHWDWFVRGWYIRNGLGSGWNTSIRIGLSLGSIVCLLFYFLLGNISHTRKCLSGPVPFFFAIICYYLLFAIIRLSLSIYNTKVWGFFILGISGINA